MTGGALIVILISLGSLMFFQRRAQEKFEVRKSKDQLATEAWKSEVDHIHKEVGCNCTCPTAPRTSSGVWRFWVGVPMQWMAVNTVLFLACVIYGVAS